MTLYELSRVALVPFAGALQRELRCELVRFIHARPHALLLDAGGRTSPQTIGLRAGVVILDLPRVSAVQERLNLGMNRDLTQAVFAHRSNIRGLIYGDMTRAPLQASCVDGVLAIEVIEHVADDDAFVRHVWRVLRPGGFSLASTPNGDRKPLDPAKYPDDKRRYTKQRLERLLLSWFPQATVRYAVRKSRFSSMSRQAWSIRTPYRTVISMVGGVMNWRESHNADPPPHAAYTLIGSAVKPQTS